MKKIATFIFLFAMLIGTAGNIFAANAADNLAVQKEKSDIAYDHHWGGHGGHGGRGWGY